MPARRWLCVPTRPKIRSIARSFFETRPKHSSTAFESLESLERWNESSGRNLKLTLHSNSPSPRQKRSLFERADRRSASSCAKFEGSVECLHHIERRRSFK